MAWFVRGMPWLTNGRAASTGALAFTGGLSGTLLAALVLNAPPGDLPFWMIALVAGSRLTLDTLAMTRSWGRIGLEYRTGRWDLLRLTAQSEGALLRAHYAAAYAGVWRPMLIALGVQTGILAALALIAVPPAPLPSWWMSLVGLALMTVVIGAELLVRPRALSALGLALSASAPRAGSAAVAGSTALILFWAVQLAALFTGLVAASFIGAFATLIFNEVRDWSWLALIAFALPLAVNVFVQRAALYRLARAVAKRDAAV